MHWLSCALSCPPTLLHSMPPFTRYWTDIKRNGRRSIGLSRRSESFHAHAACGAPRAAAKLVRVRRTQLQWINDPPTRVVRISGRLMKSEWPDEHRATWRHGCQSFQRPGSARVCHPRLLAIDHTESGHQPWKRCVVFKTGIETHCVPADRSANRNGRARVSRTVANF